jgi:hypothetical protein
MAAASTPTSTFIPTAAATAAADFAHVTSLSLAFRLHFSFTLHTYNYLSY